MVRLDQAVTQQFPEISRRKARELISEYRVLVNERPVAVASRPVGDKDRIAIAGEDSAIAIIQSTEEWLAVLKPSGVATQPGVDRSERSLEELVRVQLRRTEGTRSLFVVHRLDTPTSGIVLFARTQSAAARLSNLFATGEIKKRYLAAVHGAIAAGTTIDAPIARIGKVKFGVNAAGRESRTLVEPIATSPEATLAEIQLETGRTHQIRVHLASIGHPVLGDRKYGHTAIAAPRLMLHAWLMEHETIGRLIAPLPEDFAAFCAGRGWSMPCA